MGRRPRDKVKYTTPGRRESGNNVELIGTGLDFLNRTLVQTLRSTINKWDLMKLKIFFMAKDTINITKHQATE